MKLVWSTKAKSGFQEIGDFIAKDSPENARKHIQKLIKRAKQAVEFPMSRANTASSSSSTLRIRF
jgi:plasmid stabilization system protein ParE